MEHPYLLKLHIINQLETEICLVFQNECLLVYNAFQNPFFSSREIITVAVFLISQAGCYHLLGSSSKQEYFP